MIKRIFCFVSLAMTTLSMTAQTKLGYYGDSRRSYQLALIADSTLHIPFGTTPSLRAKGWTGAGALFYKTTDSSQYNWSGLNWWRQLNIKDTVSLLATQYDNSLLINNIVRRAGVDSFDVYKNGVFAYSVKDSVGVSVDLLNASAFTGKLNAGNVSGSNFFGNFAGNNAGNAGQSNFFGDNAGANATFATGSNFFGSLAGTGATNADASNFFGSFSGYAAINSRYSNFFGTNAGRSADSASNATFIGTNAGNESGLVYPNKTHNKANDYSILLGRYTRTNGFRNSILLGGDTSSVPVYVNNTADNQFMLAPNISKLRFKNFDYDLGADTLSTRAYSRSAGGSTYTASQGITLSGNDFKIGGYMPANSRLHIPSALILNSPVSRIIIENRSADSAFYGAAGISNIQGNTFAQPALRSARLYKEQYNDTLQLQYGGNLYAITRNVFDSTSTRFAYNNKNVSLPVQGFYGVGQIYFPRDSVNWYAGRDGFNSSINESDMDLGDSHGYNVNIVSDIPSYPISAYKSATDFIRVVDQTRRKKMTGPITNYLAVWKGHQSTITSGTFEVGNRWSNIADFTSFGSLFPTIGSTVTKAKILAVARMDTAVGFLSVKKYLPVNEVVNGYGFVALGDSDRNYFEGPTRIGGTIPGHTTQPSAILDVVSTTRGALLPRMTSTQRTAILSPAQALMVFDTDSSSYFQYTGSSWQNLYGSTPTLQQVFNTEVGASVLTKKDTILMTGTTPKLFMIAQYTPLELTSDSTIALIVRTKGPTANLIFATKTSRDSTTITTDMTLQKFSTGTVQNGYGSKLSNQLESSNGTIRMASEFVTYWNNATDANRTSYIGIRGNNNTVEQNYMTLQPDYVLINNDVDTVATRAYARTSGGGGGGPNYTVQTLTDGATITWNVSNGINAQVTIAATGRTLAITSPTAGHTYKIRIIQDATGNRTLTTWPANTKWPNGGTVPTQSNGANQYDIYEIYYDGTNYYNTQTPNFQ